MRRAIAVDAVGAKYGGAEVVATALVNAAIAVGVDVIVFASERRLRKFDFPVHARVTEVEVPAAEGRLGRLRWQNGGSGREARRLGAGALLCLSNAGVSRDVPCAVLIQQSLPFSPEALKRMPLGDRVRMAAVRRMMARSVRVSAAVMVQSSTMRECVIQLLGAPAERVQVFEPSASLPDRRVGTVADLDALAAVPKERRLLYVGSASPYKNLVVLGEAMQSLANGSGGFHLLGTFPADHELLQRPGVHGFSSPVDHSNLRTVYEWSGMLVFPSLIETVGLPILEAFETGLPVVVADRPYSRDVCGDAAMYFDPNSATDLARAVREVAASESLRSKLAAAGRERANRRSAVRPYEAMVQAVVRLAHSSD